MFLTDVDDRPLVNPVRQEVFGETRPASTLVEVSRWRSRARRSRSRPWPSCPDEPTTMATPSSPGSTSPCRRPPTGPLAGRTLLVKDLIDTAGVRTTYGSRIYGDHVPERTRPPRSGCSTRAPCSSARRACRSSPGTSPARTRGTAPCGTRPTRAARRAAPRAATPRRSPRGSSSSGSARDTGCSIRLPSACCGTVGLKPRWGVVPTEGVFPLVPYDRHRRADGEVGRGRGAALVGADRASRPPSRGSTG